MSGLAVSVVIPVRDGETYLAEAIGSVLSQTHPPAEVVVVDDGSVDGTREVASGFGPPVRVLTGPSQGASAARNRGVQESLFPLVAFLDADDTWRHSRLEDHIRRFEYDPDLEIVLGRTHYVGLEPEELRSYRFETQEPVAVLPSLGAATIRRAVFDRVGNLDTTMRLFEDWDWFQRVREEGIRMVVIDEIAQDYRRREGSSSQRVAPGDPTLPALLKRSLDRRRTSTTEPTMLGQLSDLRESKQ